MPETLARPPSARTLSPTQTTATCVGIVDIAPAPQLPLNTPKWKAYLPQLGGKMTPLLPRTSTTQDPGWAGYSNVDITRYRASAHAWKVSGVHDLPHGNGHTGRPGAFGARCRPQRSAWTLPGGPPQQQGDDHGGSGSQDARGEVVTTTPRETLNGKRCSEPRTPPPCRGHAPACMHRSMSGVSINSTAAPADDDDDDDAVHLLLRGGTKRLRDSAATGTNGSA